MSQVIAFVKGMSARWHYVFRRRRDYCVSVGIAVSIFADKIISLGTNTAHSITLIFKKFSGSWCAYSREMISLSPERRWSIRVS